MNDGNVSIVTKCYEETLETLNRSATGCLGEINSAELEVEEDLPKGLDIFLGLTIICMIFVSLLGNSVVCLIVYQKSAMRSAINLLLTNMALSDIFTAFFSMTFSFTTLFWKEYVLHSMSCKVMLFLLDTFVSVGVFMILTISMDRCMLIVQRKDKLTTCHAKILMVMAWLVSMVMAFPSVFGWGEYRFIKSHSICRPTFNRQARDVGFMILKTSATFFIPVTLTAYSFIRILSVVRKNKCRVHNHHNMDFSVSVISNNGKLGVPVLQRSFGVSVDMSFKTRAFKTILILFMTFVLCWTPYVLNILISNSTGKMSRTRHLIFLWIGYANSAINPIIYSIRIKKFRQACGLWIPDFLKARTYVTGATKRRINPSALYEYQEHSVGSS